MDAFTADLDQAIQCNCSICTKAGFIWAFVPSTRFALTTEGPMSDYFFNRHAIRHRFCTNCGIEPFAAGKDPKSETEMTAVNVRCLDDVDLAALKPKPVDGRSF